MRAYYYDDIPGDQRLPHDSGIPVDATILGVVGLRHTFVPIPVPMMGEYPTIDDICRERGYVIRDWIDVTKEGLGDIYEAKIASFFKEHMHEEEEIRYVVEGSGFFDVREHPTDKWIRCVVEPGDLLVVPSGIYHRFTLDSKDKIKAMMLFKEDPKFTYFPRSDAAEKEPFRVDYLKQIAVQ
ncbi:1,2-dihydroxy-3-keto-5-methylthiopentene dioxygenase [Chiua virens]|nr:1,2-dihydroxy-3-keto-5-methylthiopentene dioxygenase [Chiua virens]